MAIAAYFEPQSMTKEQYLEIHSRLEAAGVGLSNQPGRLLHSCVGEEPQLQVFDVWNSIEEFQAFGEHLGPILGELGVDVGEPAVMPVQFIDQREIKGEF